MRARLPAKLGAAVCLLLCAWFLAPLGMGIVHIGMLWPSALLVLAARESLRFSGYFTAYGFRNEPEEQMYHQLRMYCARFVVLAVFLLLFGFAYGTAFYAAVK